MKKYLLLTSILALAACGGGGGGGGGMPAVAVPTTPTAGTFNDGIFFNSTNTGTNSNVTQMKTQVAVNTANGNVVARHAGSAIQDTAGNNYKLYDLNDVKLKVADETGNAFLKIGLAADGTIDKMTLSSGSVESVLARDNLNSNLFKGPIFEYVKDGEDKAYHRIVDTGQTMDDLNAISASFPSGHWNYIDERMEVTTNKHISNGDANAIVLQYSDFGHFNPVYKQKNENLDADVLAAIRAGTALNRLGPDYDPVNNPDDTLDKYRTDGQVTSKLQEANYQLFAGGYAIDASGNLIDGGTFDAPAGKTFTGKGVGRVYTSIKANADGTEKEYRAAVLDQYGIAHDDTEKSIGDAGHDVTHSFTTSSAVLTVDASGNQQLVMEFPDFYTVTATKNVGQDATVTLEKPDNVTIEKKYMKTADVATQTTGDYRVIANGATSTDNPMFQPGYYGVGTATEAAGLVRYAETAGNIQVEHTGSADPVKTFTREFEFQGAYGAKLPNAD